MKELETPYFKPLLRQATDYLEKNIFDRNGITNKEIGEIISCSAENARQRRSPGNTFTLEQVFKLVEHYGLSLDEVFGMRNRTVKDDVSLSDVLSEVFKLNRMVNISFDGKSLVFKEGLNSIPIIKALKDWESVKSVGRDEEFRMRIIELMENDLLVKSADRLKKYDFMTREDAIKYWSQTVSAEFYQQFNQWNPSSSLLLGEFAEEYCIHKVHPDIFNDVLMEIKKDNDMPF